MLSHCFILPLSGLSPYTIIYGNSAAEWWCINALLSIIVHVDVLSGNLGHQTHQYISYTGLTLPNCVALESLSTSLVQHPKAAGIPATFFQMC